MSARSSGLSASILVMLALWPGPARAATPLDADAIATRAVACAVKDECKQALCPDANTVYCMLADESLAELALVADPITTRWLHQQAGAKLTPSSTNRSVQPRVGMLPTVGPTVAPAADVATAGLVGALDLQERIAVLLAGLARLVEDRAKQESFGWALDSLGGEVCDPSVPALRTDWFRAFCALADGERLAGYGSGEASFQAVRAAVESDARDVPGVIAGIAFEPVITKVAEGRADDEAPVEAARRDALKEALRGALREVVDGGDPLLALAELGRRLGEVNYSGGGGLPTSASAQLLACGLAFPSAHARAVEQLDAGVTPGGVAVALTLADPCFDLLGSGATFSRDNSAWWATGEVVSAAASSGRVERLTTLVRLHDQLEAPTASIAEAWSRAEGARERVTTLAKQFDTAYTELQAALAERAEKAGTDEEEDSDAAVANALLAEVELGRRVALANLDLLDAGLDLARIGLDTVETALPYAAGLCTVDKKPTTPAERGRCPAGEPKVGSLAAMAKAVDDLDDGLGVARDLVSGHPGAAIAGAMRFLPEVCAKDEAEAAVECRRQVKVVAGYAGGLAAIVESDTPDEAARALHGVVNPPGGWKAKQKKEGATAPFTASITAHPGFGGGVEWRTGPYGLHYERGAAYAVMPTLVMPIGPELSWAPVKGWNWGFFFPILDPGGFLQYDVSEGGALPAPHLLTAVNLGAGARMAIPTTPFGVLTSVSYRPRLRAYGNDALGPAADAWQLNLSATVDVTLLRLNRVGGK